MSHCDQARTDDVFHSLVEILSQVPVDHPMAVGVELIPAPTMPVTPHHPAPLVDRPLADWSFTTPFGEVDAEPQVQLAFRPLDCDDVVCALAGFVAPPHWHGFGIVAPGRARRIGPDNAVDHVQRWPHDDHEQYPVTLSVLVDRTNTSRSVIRDGFGRRMDVPIRQSGRVLDACQRVLGLPTAAESTSVSTWVTLSWLDAVLAATLEADLGEPPTWAELDHLEPFEFGSLGDGSTIEWATARQACASGSLVAWPVSAGAAAWMDDAMFSRETVQAYPPLIDTLRDLRSLLGPDTFDRLVERISNDLSR